mmetsp:Transcript_36643/g.80025  ORF Transcript_36643/g.80025 Transcript_36643/m.80025 type:complete len:229 (+) Transcript_36643:202-888(+)
MAPETGLRVHWVHLGEQTPRTQANSVRVSYPLFAVLTLNLLRFLLPGAALSKWWRYRQPAPTASPGPPRLEVERRALARVGPQQSLCPWGAAARTEILSGQPPGLLRVLDRRRQQVESPCKQAAPQGSGEGAGAGTAREAIEAVARTAVTPAPQIMATQIFATPPRPVMLELGVAPQLQIKGRAAVLPRQRLGETFHVQQEKPGFSRGAGRLRLLLAGYWWERLLFLW